jgi:hypothetical protein
MRPRDGFDTRSIEPISFEEGATQLEALIARIESLGIPVPAGSRLRRYVGAFNQVRRAVHSNNVSPTVPVDLVHQAFLETSDLALVIEQLSRDPQDALWTEKLAIGVRGPELPQIESKNSPARDLQFELTVAAMCRAAGLSVRLAEPDVVVTGMAIPFGIAAKRLKSLRGLEQHVRKARAQIQQTGLGGIIAIEISAAVNSENAIVEVRTGQAITAWAEAEAGKFIDKYLADILRWVHDSQIFGLAVYCKALASTDRGAFATARRWSIVNTCPQNDERFEQLRLFADRLGAICQQE